MSKTTTTFAVMIVVIATCFITQQTFAQGRFDGVEIKTTKITDSVYMLVGAGGNIGLSVGEDGAFMIDDQFAPLTEKILAAVSKITDNPVRFLVNTHRHGDHVGGNENMGKAGAIIVSHENVRKYMSTNPSYQKVALPVVTFAHSLTLHWNGDEINVQHVDPAHTDGDSIIHFKNANVIHMGDTFFNGMYPYIDVSSGGSIDGMIAAADTALKLCDSKTKIIPGHGELSDADGLRTYRNLLQDVRNQVRSLIDAGKSRDEVISAKLTAKYDVDWGGSDFMPPDKFVGIVFDGMVKEE